VSLPSWVSRAVPMTVIRRAPDHVASANFLDRTAFALGPAAARGNDQRLIAEARAAAVVAAGTRPLGDFRLHDRPYGCPILTAGVEHDRWRAASAAIEIEASPLGVDELPGCSSIYLTCSKYAPRAPVELPGSGLPLLLQVLPRGVVTGQTNVGAWPHAGHGYAGARIAGQCG
jgi:hypothetical protein